MFKSKFYLYGIIGCLLIAYIAVSFLHKALFTTNNATVEFYIDDGNTVSNIAYNLYEKNLIYSPKVLIFLAKISVNTKNLHAGEYEVLQRMNLWDLLHKFKNGNVIKRNITLVEGWTFSQIKQALAQNNYLKHDLSDLSDQEIMQTIGLSGKRPEGLFAPDTYVFSGKISDKIILQHAYNLMQKRLNSAWEQYQKSQQNLPYKCPYDILIMASMLEKESAISQERPLIAGVILNRLKIGMPLQIDATVIYGNNRSASCLIEKQCNLPKLTIKDLKNDNAYNTYTRKGLPIAPISAPSLNSIQSAINPIKTDYLYYVADGTGRHVFSKTLEEHNKAKFEAKNQNNHNQP